MRVTPTPAVSLLATHTALDTGVHGVVSPKVLNEILDTLTIVNAGVGANPVLTANNAAQQLDLTGQLYTLSHLMTARYLRFKSDTTFLMNLRHAITAAREVTFPDADITVVGVSGNAAQSRVFSLSCVAFPEVNNWVLAADNNEMLNTSGTLDESCTPVKLPHGATITALRATIKGDGSNPCLVYLQRGDKAGGASLLAEVSRTTNTYAEESDTTITYPIVDNDTYDYYLNLINNSGNPVGLTNVQIDYTVTVPFP